MLPVAPGAYGQPPRPPIDASNRRTPRSSAVTTLASPVPRVLWKCSEMPSALMPASLERVEQRVDARRRGHAGGVAEAQAVGAAVAQARRDAARPRASGTSPSYGQPNAVDTIASTGVPGAVGQRGELGSPPSIDSSTERFTLRRLCVSLALTTTSSSSTAGRERQLGALHVGHQRPVRRHPGRRVMPAMTSSAPAMGGIAFGRHERHRLDLAQPGGAQRVDQPDPVLDRDRRLVLQAVARAHLADLDGAPASWTSARQATGRVRSQLTRRRRTRILTGVGPRSNVSRIVRST